MTQEMVEELRSLPTPFTDEETEVQRLQCNYVAESGVQDSELPQGWGSGVHTVLPPAVWSMCPHAPVLYSCWTQCHQPALKGTS